jgi:hypothetical protein
LPGNDRGEGTFGGHTGSGLTGDRVSTGATSAGGPGGPGAYDHSTDKIKGSMAGTGTTHSGSHTTTGGVTGDRNQGSALTGDHHTSSRGTDVTGDHHSSSRGTDLTGDHSGSRNESELRSGIATGEPDIHAGSHHDTTQHGRGAAAASAIGGHEHRSHQSSGVAEPGSGIAGSQGYEGVGHQGGFVGSEGHSTSGTGVTGSHGTGLTGSHGTGSGITGGATGISGQHHSIGEGYQGESESALGHHKALLTKAATDQRLETHAYNKHGGIFDKDVTSSGHHTGSGAGLTQGSYSTGTGLTGSNTGSGLTGQGQHGHHTGAGVGAAGLAGAGAAAAGHHGSDSRSYGDNTNTGTGYDGRSSDLNRDHSDHSHDNSKPGLVEKVKHAIGSDDSSNTHTGTGTGGVGHGHHDSSRPTDTVRQAREAASTDDQYGAERGVNTVGSGATGTGPGAHSGSNAGVLDQSTTGSFGHKTDHNRSNNEF